MLVTKGDLPDAPWFEAEARSSFPGLPVERVSHQGDLKQAIAMIWSILNLIRVWPCPNGRRAKEPVVLPRSATVEHFVANLDQRWIKRFRTARVTGSSAKFDNQPVGKSHELADGDEVRIQLKN